MEQNIKHITKIQSCARGYIVRKVLKQPGDDFSYDMVLKTIDKYIYDINFNKDLNSQLKENNILSKINNPRDRKVRNYNFPPETSENIAKFAIYKKYRVMPTWYTDKGDLFINKNIINILLFIRIEVKGFMSDGPSSFGPKEEWDWIYFVDAADVENKNFKVYEIKCSNTNENWKNIKIKGTDFNINDCPDVPDNLENYNKNKLKELCEQRGLLVGGNKNDLIQRLKIENPGSKFKKPKTYHEICIENKRGELRGYFEKIFKPQLGELCELIFDGHISELNPDNFL